MLHRTARLTPFGRRIMAHAHFVADLAIKCRAFHGWLCPRWTCGTRWDVWPGQEGSGRLTQPSSSQRGWRPHVGDC